MSAFDDLDADLSAQVDGIFGDDAVILPRIPAEFGGGAEDPTRPERPVRCIYSSGPLMERAGGVQGSGGFTGPTRRATQSATVWIDAASLRGLGYALKPGDLITLTDRNLSLMIRAIHPSDRGDAEISVTETAGDTP